MKNILVYVILTLVQSGLIHAQELPTADTVKTQMVSSDKTRKMLALKQLISNCQTVIKRTQTSGNDKEAKLVDVRRYLQPVQPELIQLAGDKDSRVRSLSCYLLGLTQPNTEVIRTVTALISDSEDDVRRTALGSIVAIGGDTPEARKLILEILTQRANASVFRYAAKVAGEWRMKEAVLPLAESLHSDNNYVKQVSAQVLDGYGSEAISALPDLKRALNETSDQKLKELISSAIENIN